VKLVCRCKNVWIEFVNVVARLGQSIKDPLHDAVVAVVLFN
jgi:hypothetical protein